MPPPPPKQFTDEELKQQYGIHMATRLHSDEPGKESKWADIDDDEDDWAPDTVEWMDGTKSSVEIAAKPLIETKKPSAPNLEVKGETSKLSENSPQRKASTTSAATGNVNKTVLRPSAQPTALPAPIKSGGLILKASTEKPSLTAKQSAPPPTKSPWAPLPPISKVSPVAVNPPSSGQPLNPAQALSIGSQQRENTEPEAVQSGPSPTREIAADDFNRKWRDEGGNKELFNSQSGRYEPVSSRRRSSNRFDQGYRQPAVLQRPNQTNQPQVTETLAQSYAIQANDNADTRTWARRRASSNLSGKGLSQMKGLHANMANRTEEDSKRQVQNLNSAEATHSQSGEKNLMGADHGTSAKNNSNVNRSSPRPVESNEEESQGSSQQQPGADGEPQQTGADYVTIQRQIMREKTELARARKREEEEKEEAARRERIRLKLQSLGMTSKQQPEDERQDKGETKKTPEKRITDAPVRQTKRALPKREEPVAASSPPKPPIPTSVGEVAQYGMMKVHQPQPLRKAVLADNHIPDKHSAERQTNTRNMHMTEESARATRSMSPGKAPKKISQEAVSATLESHLRNRPQAELQKPSPSPSKSPANQWKHSDKVVEPLGSWTNSSMASHSLPSSNVWGAPNTLGNGTFDAGYGQVASRALQQQQQKLQGPGPIAPPSSAKGGTSQPGNDTSISREVNAVGSAPTRVVLPHSNNQQQTSGPKGQVSSAADSNPAMQTKVSIPYAGAQSTGYGIGAWNNFSSQLGQSEEEARNRLERDFRSTSKNDVQNASFKETFVQTGKYDSHGERTIVNKETNYHDQGSITRVGPDSNNESIRDPNLSASIGSKAKAGSSISNSDAQLPMNASQPGLLPAHAAQHQFSGRPLSRFFPRSQDNLSQNMPLSDQEAPPPPDPLNHPVYSGNNQHPVVHLPVPKVVVKLPPLNVTPNPTVSLPVSASPIRLGSQPIVTQAAWQNRIDHLLNRKQTALSSPPKPQALTIAPSTKAPLDVSSHKISATVSLPASPEESFKSGQVQFPLSADRSSSPVSKPTFEDLAEPLQFASRPPVCMPKAPFRNSVRGPFPFTRYLQQSPKPQITSILSSFYFLDDIERTSNGYRVQIRLPGANGRKSVIIPLAKPRQQLNNKRRGQGKIKDVPLPPRANAKARRPLRQ